MDKQLVLVLTMGRVGSSAVYHSLKELPSLKVFHIHHITQRTLEARAPDGIEAAGRNVRDGFEARAALSNSEGAVKVVTLVRDAIERNMSTMFARFQRGRDQEDMEAVIDNDEAMAKLWSRFDTSLPFTWFDDELLTEFGIDVYESHFPHSRGLDRLRNGRYDALIMRSDITNDAKSEALSDFVDATVDVEMSNRKTQPGGGLRSTYERFMSTAPLDADTIRDIGRSRYMQHFFNVDVDQYVDGWLGRLKRDAS